MSPQEKVKKPYAAPGFQVVNKDMAKVLLESKTIPDDAGTRQMLGLIREIKSSSESRDGSESKACATNLSFIVFY